MIGSRLLRNSSKQLINLNKAALGFSLRPLSSNETLIRAPLSVNDKTKINFRSLNSIRSLSLTNRRSNNTVKCPPFADSISEGDVQLVKEVGDSVTEDETVMEIETDKTSIPVPAPSNGTITEILVEEGQTVSPGEPLFIMVAGEGAPAAAPAAPKAEAPKAEESKPVEAAPAPVAAAPVAAAVSQSLGAAPAVNSTPITKPAEIKAMAAELPEGVAAPRAERRVKMSRMRQRIAQRLKDSQNTAALLTTFNEIDMTNIMALRNKYKDDFLKKHGIKLGFMSAFSKASAYALEQSPIINAVIDDATNEIVYRDFVDISVAVSTDKGLVVPVLRNVEKMDYFGIEKELNNLATKAREGKITPEDMDGGTFTISNGGVYGSMFGTPIVNPPQSAILGMHGTQMRPVARDGQVVIRPMMYIALTYDHRLIDGKDAVTFLKKIKHAVEDPNLLLLNL